MEVNRVCKSDHDPDSAGKGSSEGKEVVFGRCTLAHEQVKRVDKRRRSKR
jgi:hypothetical protein